MIRTTRRLSMPFRQVEMRAANGGASLTFTGYASVTDTPYVVYDWLGSYSERIAPGAFTKTLSEGADVCFLVNHEGISLARTKSGTLRLAEDSIGLHVEADLDPTSPHVIALRSGVDRHDIDEMSFAFIPVRERWSPDYSEVTITEVAMDKCDVSAVNYGANPATSIGGMRSFGTRETARMRARLTPILASLRAGATLGAADMAALTHILDALTVADAELDESLAVLADVLGVPNPDPDADADADAGATDEATDDGTADMPYVEALRAADIDLIG